MYRIVAIVGASGSGKTTITNRLQGMFPDMYHIVESMTDRPRRGSNEKGHYFVSEDFMDCSLQHDDIVAYTRYGEYRYCSTIEQFDTDKINLYIVDNQGIIDLINYEGADTEIFVLMLKTHYYTAPIDRRKRDTPINMDLVDTVVWNDGAVLETVGNVHNKIDIYMGGL